MLPIGQYLWNGPRAQINTPSVEGADPQPAAVLEPGAPVYVVGPSPEGGLWCAAPPIPFLFEVTEPRQLRAPADAEGRVDAAGLLGVLRQDNVVELLKELNSTRPDELKAAAEPLLNPLLETFVPANMLPAVKQALVAFGVKTA